MHIIPSNVVNRNLGDMLRYLASERPLLAQAEFTYNSSMNKTKTSPFEIIYGYPISHYLDRSFIPYFGGQRIKFDNIIEHIQKHSTKGS